VSLRKVTAESEQAEEKLETDEAPIPPAS